MPGRETAAGNGAGGAPRVDPARSAVPDYGRQVSGEYPRVEYPPPGPPPPPPSSGGLPRSGDGLRLEPPTAAPRRRLPELVLGIFLVAGCALAAVLLAAAGRERTPALVLTGDIQRGQVISADDLDTVYIGSDGDLAYVDPDAIGEIVDRVAVVNLPGGTLVTREQFVDPASVGQPGDATTGVALEAGQLPTLQLAPGDLVTVVAGGGAGSSQEAEVVAEAAVVESVTETENNTGQQPRWWVSLRMSESDATNLAMANASNARIQLVMVER